MTESLGRRSTASGLLWAAACSLLFVIVYGGCGWITARRADVGACCFRWELLIPFVPAMIVPYWSLDYYRRCCRPWDQAAPNLLIGRRLNDDEARAVIQQGVTAVLDLTAESSEAGPLLGTSYRNIPILDLTAPSPGQMKEAVSFIQGHAGRGVVYVHCKAGYSRSAAVVGAYLLTAGMARTAEETAAILRKVRPGIVIRPEALEALRSFQAWLGKRPTAPARRPACDPARVEAL
ncbi:MAG: dual specificity protein phosphatase family protein [Elusimicrobia bacterium]|nr:dual specificity protein phosphatase family protein [Elusimicrobiota bacterium]